ncbi:MAG: CAP domain-containing protein [Candidatus Micrarchaeota archaeon]|nr:CAP domain-containing protein [Candidatus Micrarchaeota archaeon]
MGVITGILLLIVIVLLVVVFYPKIIAAIHLAGSLISNAHLGSNYSFPNVSTNQSNHTVSSGPAVNYALELINKDRSSHGLKNVTLSPISSAQQHAASMLRYGYFSHWDIYGMKPYMRYTLVGGLGSVQENVAYTKSGVKACLGTLCTSYGNLNVTSSLSQMEYNMVYNDSACCNNGHRDNILDPNHNQVSIGIAYNSTTVYFVEDFINNYITWLNSTPSINNNDQMVFEGGITPGYSLSTIEVSYDQPLLNMSQSQLDQTSEYGYGQPVAGIVSSPVDYYPSLTTIVADTYYIKGNDFLVSFNMNKLIKDNGPGEYTVSIWLNGTSANNSFIGSTYTIFVDQNGNVYQPSKV